jgi:cyclase
VVRPRSFVSDPRFSVELRRTGVPLSDPRSAKFHFHLDPVARGVWAAIARDGGYGLCNSGIIDLGGITVVYDSMLTPVAADRLRLAARRCTGRVPDVVINSHWHGDHIRGNAVFAPAAIVSTPKTRALIRTSGVRQWTSDRRSMPAALRALDSPSSTVPRRERALYRGWFEGTLRVPTRFRPLPPNVTFERELTITGTRAELRVLTYGGGHSPSDVFAFEPDSRVTLLGDLASVGLHPSTGDGVPSRWVGILRRIRRLQVGPVVPGHGPVGGVDDVRLFERYLCDLDRLARAAQRQGESIRAVRSTPVPSAYGTWKFSSFFADNLAHSFALAGSRRTRTG